MATLKLSKSPAASAATKKRAGADDVPSAAVSRRARAGLLNKKKAPAEAPAPAAPTRTAKARPPRAENSRPRPQPFKPQAKPVHPPAPTPASVEHPPGSLRLSKRMSELGLASRREADEWIERGWVRVDGTVVNELGARVLPHQTVSVDRRAENEQAQRVTILLNKPVGFVSGQAEDGHQPAIKLILPENHWEADPVRVRFKREHLRNLAPAGRLDIDSVGLLVLTQDGRTAKLLVGEHSPIEKEYLVRVEYTLGRKLPADKLALLNHGLELDGEALLPALVEWQNEDQLRFVLREGKKRQIRRMCEAVGLKVTGLKRIRIGKVLLGDLPPGQWRYLDAQETF